MQRYVYILFIFALLQLSACARDTSALAPVVNGGATPAPQAMSYRSQTATPIAQQSLQVFHYSSNTPTIKPTPTPRHSQEVKPSNPAPVKTLIATAPQHSSAWQWPARGKVIQTYSAENKGINIAGKYGEPVMTTAAGVVVYAGSGLRGYGKLLIIKHNDNFLSAYAHNSELLVKEGDTIKRNQIIARMGKNNAGQVLLHFEIRNNGKPVDPLQFLARR
ncbi:MAG: peptidoglycan DD-metalloendopeptidase family protein [Legionellales bacterium]|nr:peptidoglycan DD-metalloendopeptidase family protein [Legionellales bacterium]